MSTEIDTYKHLDKDSQLELALSIPEVAKRICALNYGTHRLLSALVHELRGLQDDYNKRMRLAHGWEPEVSPLAEGIEALLNQGHTR